MQRGSDHDRGVGDGLRARALVLLLGLLWGLNWPAVKIALGEISPWLLRTLGIGLGALTLLLWAWAGGRSLRIPPGWPRLHLALIGLLNIAAFNLFSAFAQLAATTSRVTIVTYSMPVWATLLAWPLLGERLDARRGVALALGAAGLLVLLAPLLDGGLPLGLLYALGSAVSWAAGTLYLKRVRIQADSLAIAAWQLVAGAGAAALGLLLFEADPHAWPLSASTLAALAYHVLCGTALAYFIWFTAAARLPAGTASLGTLVVPVVGVVSAMLLLGERPTVTDLAGFLLVLAAAATVLLQPQRALS